MIESKDLLQLLVTNYLGLRKHLVAEADGWLTEAGEISPCALFRLTSNLVSRQFSNGAFESAAELFGVVEHCLAAGSRDVADAAATCFLENLASSPEIAPMAVHFMGELSKSHCRAWDTFTGVGTVGLDSGHNGT